jgi:DNA-directed RNA polymerase specialized sigma24 family protein
MSDVTRILSQIDAGDPTAAELLLPLVYKELRKLAAAKLTQEKPGQTLQATALVHEAYLRLVGGADRRQETEESNPSPDSFHRSPGFSSRGHFFAAAAEAMRRILVERARRRQRYKHGGDWVRTMSEPDTFPRANPEDPLLVLAIHEALERLAKAHPRKAELVKLRYFLGCTVAGRSAAGRTSLSPNRTLRTECSHKLGGPAWIGENLRWIRRRASQAISSSSPYYSRFVT